MANNTGQLAADEAGSKDNRLTINPNDFGGFAADWEDGQTYQVLVTVTQITSGDFEVTDAVDKTGAATEEPAPEGEVAPALGELGGAEAGGGAAYPNPAVNKLMQ